METLSELKIKATMAPELAALCGDIHILESVDSTNVWLLNRMKSGAVKCGDVCVAQMQTAGRGRRGKRWVSPNNGNLYLSFLWSDRQPERDSGASMRALMTLSLGVGIAKILIGLGVDDVTVKWPNDVLVKNKKIAGILVERVISGSHIHEIIGIGINLNATHSGVDEVKDRLMVGSLSEYIPECMSMRNMIVSMLIETIISNVLDEKNPGSKRVLNEFRKLDALMDREIVVIDNLGGRATGRYMGVTEEGALMVDYGRGVKSLYSADVSVRIE